MVPLPTIIYGGAYRNVEERSIRKEEYRILCQIYTPFKFYNHFYQIFLFKMRNNAFFNCVIPYVLNKAKIEKSYAIPSGISLPITSPNFQHISPKMHVWNVHVLMKIRRGEKCQNILLLASLYGSFCNGWSSTRLSDSLDVHDWSDYVEKDVGFNICKTPKIAPCSQINPISLNANLS